MSRIKKLSAIEILDSRGRPTIQVSCLLDDGATATAQVPSGASTGRAEAVELRDEDPNRHAGLGCLKAVARVNETIASAMQGLTFNDQADVDRALIDLDGTADKSRLGGNAILGVSIAVARAVANERGVPLFEHFAELAGQSAKTMPRLTINLFSGGKHAGGQVPIQDVLLVPVSASTIAEGLAMVCEIYRTAAELIQKKYSARLLTADEGGLAPPFSDAKSMLDDTVEAIHAAGLTPGTDVSIAMDLASSHFYRNEMYHLKSGPVAAAAMIDQVSQWADDYPIVSIEDPLAEDDWAHWPAMCSMLSGRALTVGDDLLCTNPDRIRRAIDSSACDTLLLKVNQIGTLTEAAESLRLARDAGWRVTISARSGETEDNWLADLAVGWNADQIKVGSVTQSERLAKYNRLLAIEAERQYPVVAWPKACK